MRRGELVNWYLKEVEADIETIEELAEKKVLVEKVIDRLVQHVSQLVTVVTVYVTIMLQIVTFTRHDSMLLYLHSLRLLGSGHPSKYTV